MAATNDGFSTIIVPSFALLFLSAFETTVASILLVNAELAYSCETPAKVIHEGAMQLSLDSTNRTDRRRWCVSVRLPLGALNHRPLN